MAESSNLTTRTSASLRKPLVLLFYDGFEWRAREGVLPGLWHQGRRLARFLYRTVRRRQVRTGFYTAFVALRTALERAGCDVRVNDFALARKMPEYPIGIAGYPEVLQAVDGLPNPRIFGPGDYGAPEAIMNDPRIRLLIQPSDWFRDYCRASLDDRVVTWFAGIDTERWQDLSGREKSVDVLIYDKIRWHRDTVVPALLDRLTAHLDARGLRWRVLRYGHHHQGEFVAGLAASKSLAFLCEHETQGLACQEAMATNIPVFAWDEGVLVDPQAAPAAPPGLAVSSVPYFDARCGRRFTLADVEGAFDGFWADLPGYRPREYVCEALSMEASALAYMDLYAGIARRDARGGAATTSGLVA